MIDKVSFSKLNQEIHDIYKWYELCKNGIYAEKNNISNEIENGENIPVEFIGLTKKEFDKYFENAVSELENVSCLSILAAVEAKIRVDYLIRVYDKKKDALSRIFRDLYKEKENKAALDNDLLDNWVFYYPSLKGIIGDFKGVLKYRNWLAHGRYWIPKLARKSYDIFTIYNIADNIIVNLIK